MTPPPTPILCPPTVAVNLAKLKLFRHYYVMVGVPPFPRPASPHLSHGPLPLTPMPHVSPGHLLYLLHPHHRHPAARGCALPVAVAVPGERSRAGSPVGGGSGVWVARESRLILCPGS